MKNTLYKYFPLTDEKTLQRVIECIRGKIYFSNPFNFNDPFELQAIVSPPTPSQVDHLLNHGNGQTTKETKSFRNKVYHHFNNEFRRSPPSIATPKWLSEIGVLSLTESPKNLLMWAHYGSNHKGICIGFSTKERPFSTAKRVLYTHTRPCLPFDSYRAVKIEDAEGIFLSKSIEWEYESEWRCVKRTIGSGEKEYYRQKIQREPETLDEIADLMTDHGGPGNYDFENTAIKRIYFGCRIDASAKETLLNAIRENRLSSKVFQLKIDPRNFQLNDERIKKKHIS